MFRDRSYLIRNNLPHRCYGVAVTDIDRDGAFELFVTGYAGSPNRVFKHVGDRLVENTPLGLEDAERYAIGVAAGDIDADGSEEIYVLNTDTFAGQKSHVDRLLDYADGQWTDLFALSMHRDLRNFIAGRSVACIDRCGTGRYGFFVASYGGPMRLYELDEDGQLADVGEAAGINLTSGGRSLLSLPLVTARMDVFAGNEGGPNFLFRNLGGGTFEEIGAQAGISDSLSHARGVAALDADGDGRFDLVVGNWEGVHQMFYQVAEGRFHEHTPTAMALPSRVRTVIAADFDNDGFEEIFFNNIGEPNRLFAFRAGTWVSIPLDDALEPHGSGTGAAVGDFDGDGRLELLIAHGEQAVQPLSYYHAVQTDHHYLRVLPLTRWGAPARGAVVRMTAGGRAQLRAIDAGSGYLCQMEPVAHFGLGTAAQVERVEITWPDGAARAIEQPAINQLHTVTHPDTDAV